MVKRKRLFFDCEVSPNIGFFWSPGHKISISYENIIKERAIICICWKWEGEKKIHSLTWDSKQSDKKMLQTFIKEANRADELVGHNSDRFDITWIRTRCLFHGIPVIPNYQTIDTLKFARSKFRFNSNRLDYIGKFLGVGGKHDTSFSMWSDIVLKKCKTSLRKMVAYCKQDVKLLEDIFERMNPYLPAKTHYGVKYGGLKRDCPECGSENVKVSMTRVSASGVKKHDMVCKDCGKHHSVNGKVSNK